MSVELESKTRIANLISAANAKTGGSDTDLTSAVAALIAGFGSGGGGGLEKFYETEFVVDEISTLTGEQPYLTISTGLQIEYANEFMLAVITNISAEEASGVYQNFQPIASLYGAPSPIKAFAYRNFNNNTGVFSGQAIGFFIYSLTTDFSTIEIYGRNNSVPPKAGTHRFELYRTGLVI